MSLSLIRELYLTLADIKFRLDAEGDTEANRTLHAFFQVYGPKMRDALGVDDFRGVQLWKPTTLTVNGAHCWYCGNVILIAPELGCPTCGREQNTSRLHYGKA